MKVQKQVLFTLELQGDEVEVFKEALFKIVAVEAAISPNVMKMLDDKQTKLLEQIFETIKD